MRNLISPLVSKLSVFSGRAVLAAALFGGLFLVGVPQAHADRFNDCRERIDHAQARLDRDIARHGRFSRQADHDRARVEDARAWCRTHGVRY